MAELVPFTNLPPNSDGSGAPTVWGQNVTVTSPIEVTGLSYYLGSLTWNRPTYLYLFNRTTGNLLQAVAVPSATETGWHTLAIDPVTLQVGTTYFVAEGSAVSLRIPYWPSNPPAPDSPFVGGTLYVGGTGGPTPPIPTTTSTAARAGVSVGDTAPGGGGGGSDPPPSGEPNPGTIDPGGSLAWWLHKDTTNTDSLPLLTKDVVDAFRVAFDTVVGSVTSTASATGTLFQRVNQVLVDTAALLGRIPTTITTGFDQLFSWFGSAGLPAGADTIPTGIQAIRDALDADVGVELLRERLDLSPALSDTARWTLVGTTTGAGDGAVTDQADLYLLSIVAIPTLANQRVIGIRTWLPRWGWVAPVVKGYVRERQFHDFDQVAITAGGLFMSGLLIHTGEGWEWSVDAYVLDRA